MFPTLIEGINEPGSLNDHGPFKARYHMFYESRSKDIFDGLPQWKGKKGDGPMNEAAEEMQKELEKQEKEKENQKKQESEDKDGDRSTKKQKRS